MFLNASLTLSTVYSTEKNETW